MLKHLRELLAQQYGKLQMADKAYYDLLIAPRILAFRQMVECDMGSLWSEDDVSFYLAFVLSTLKAESSPDAALDLSEIPGNLKELLDKNAIIVKLKSVQAAVNFLVSDAETQETINTALSEAVQPSKEDSNSAVVNLDDAMVGIMKLYRSRTSEHLTACEEQKERLFDMFTSSGILAFREFKDLLMYLDKTRSQDSILQLYNFAVDRSHTIGTNDDKGISKRVWKHIATERDLVPHLQPHFVDVVQLARQTQEMKEIKGPEELSWTPSKPELVKTSRKHKLQGTTRTVLDLKRGRDATDAIGATEKTEDEKSRLKLALRANYLFRHLYDRPLEEEVCSLMERQSCRAGDYIITQGRIGDHFYVCEKGEFEVVMGGETVHSYRADASCNEYPSFGELALLTGRPRQASIVAKTPGVLWKLSLEGFRMAARLVNGVGSRQEILTSLRHVQLFARLDFDQQERLAAKFTQAELEPSVYVYHQGDAVHAAVPAFFLILFGSVYLMKPGEERSKIRLGAGEFFGEEGLLDEETRESTVLTCSKLVLAHISRRDVEEVVGPLDALVEE
ncbi:MAG: hypothetical protein SGPRY_013728 [Prymnesium sp.]